MGSGRGRVAHPYGELIELAELQQTAIAGRDYEALAAIVHARETLIAALPKETPEEAREAALALIELEKKTEAALQQAASGIGLELGRLRSGRAGVRRYAPARVGRARRTDVSA